MDSLKDERRRVIEAESELKEKSVMQRLKFSEAMQHIADLKQTIAQLELKVIVTYHLFIGNFRCGMIFFDLNSEK